MANKKTLMANCTDNAICSLPMYDLPELRQATETWLNGLIAAWRNAGLRYLPTPLYQSHNAEDDAVQSQWRDPNLTFSQCCGMDFVTGGVAHLQLLATPCYDTPYCDGPNYCSLILVRANDPAQTLMDLQKRRAVVNMEGSHSGYNALRYLIAPLVQEVAQSDSQDGVFFKQVINSGSHVASLQALQDGQADVAAVDGVTFSLLEQYRPAITRGLRILTQSPKAPGLPYVTHRTRSAEEVQQLRDGLQAALSDPTLAEARYALRIRDIQVLPASAYRIIADMIAHAEHYGYAVIR